MKNCRNPLRFAKCGFFILLAVSAIFLLKSALVFKDKEGTTTKQIDGGGSITVSPINRLIGMRAPVKDISDAEYVAKKPKPTEGTSSKQIDGSGSNTPSPTSRLIGVPSPIKPIKRITDVKHVSQKTMPTKPKNTFYLPETFSHDYTRQMVRSDFHSCIAQPSKTFCVEPQKTKVPVGRKSSSPSEGVALDANDSKSHKGSGGQSGHSHPIHTTFIAFTRLCKALGIKPVLIEPSILFCILNENSQKLLVKRRFNMTIWTGGENVLTFAINESDSSKFSDPAAAKEFLQADFNHWSIGVAESDDNPPEVSSDHPHRSAKTHHFFVRQKIVVHAVVFYQQNSYLWHAGIDMLPNEVLNFTPVESLLFSQYEAIYERFLPVEVPAEPVLEVLYIPSDPRFFLHQMESSQLLYCNLSNAVYAKKTTDKDHGYMSHEKFIRLTELTLQEMKVQLSPELMTFWIVGGTLLGWYRECGVIPYTTDVDFAAWAEDVDDPNELLKKFIDNKKLRLYETMGIPREALEYKFRCNGLNVDLFFTYDDGEHYWISGHRPSKGYYFPYIYPKFTLCSAELLGHKVQVPCDSLEMLLADYGPEWVKPISSWNYEVSPKNMGKKKYWEKDERPLTYKLYA